MDERQEKFEVAVREWERAMKAVLETMPKNYDGLIYEVGPIITSFNIMMAKHLEPAFNREASSRAVNAWNYQQMQVVADWANYEAYSINLSLKSEELGNRPAILAVEMQGEKGTKKKTGLWYFESFTDERWERTQGSETLPKLKLTGFTNDIYRRYIDEKETWLGKLRNQQNVSKGKIIEGSGL